MTIEQRRICHGYGGPSYAYPDPGYGYGYGYRGYGLGVAPFSDSTVFDDDDYDHHWRGNYRRRY